KAPSTDFAARGRPTPSAARRRRRRGPIGATSETNRDDPRRRAKSNFESACQQIPCLSQNRRSFSVHFYCTPETREKERPGHTAPGRSGGRGNQNLSSGAWCRFRRRSCHRSLDILAALRRRQLGCARRFEAARRHGQILTFPNEGKAVLALVPVDANQIAEMNLLGGQQIRQRIDNVAFNGALQMACAVALIGAFLKQEILTLVGDAEKELALGGLKHTLLHLAKFDVENFFKLLALQGV